MLPGVRVPTLGTMAGFTRMTRSQVLQEKKETGQTAERCMVSSFQSVCVCVCVCTYVRRGMGAPETLPGVHQVKATFAREPGHYLPIPVLSRG